MQDKDNKQNHKSKSLETGEFKSDFKIEDSSQGGFQSVGEILKNFNPMADKYISREFQAYGYWLAEQLGDLKHKALYIKYAKEIPRPTLEEALTFVKSAGKVKSRARLFMWKLKQLRKK